MKPTKRSAFLCAALVLASNGAWAQGDSSPEYVEARQRLQEGKTLYAKNDIDGARLKFEQACAVLRTPACQRALGLAQFYTKRYLEALSNLQRALEDAELDTVQRKQVTDLMQQSYDKTGHLEIHAPAGAHVRIDDTVDAGNAPLHETVHVTIGSHTISVQVDEKTERKTMECTEGKVVKVDFTDRFPGLQSVGGHKGGSNPPIVPESSWNGRRTAGVVVGGAGLLAGGFAIGFGISAAGNASDRNQLKNGLSPSACFGVTSSTCAAINDKAHAAADQSNTAIGLAIGGAALLATGLVLVVLPVSHDKHAWLWIRPSIGFLEVGARW